LETEWNRLKGDSQLERVDISRFYIEGARQQVHLTSYERNPRARAECLDSHGYSCFVCNFNFEVTYGEIGKDFIHVHHLRPLSEIGNEYKVNPVKDLCPVCPNCHAMLHRNTDEGFISIESLKEIIKKNSQQDACS
jgi:5-methylcytosine-specific restriction protein A